MNEDRLPTTQSSCGDKSADHSEDSELKEEEGTCEDGMPVLTEQGRLDIQQLLFFSETLIQNYRDLENRFDQVLAQKKHSDLES